MRKRPFHQLGSLQLTIQGYYWDASRYGHDPNFFGPNKVNHAHYRLTRIKHFARASDTFIHWGNRTLESCIRSQTAQDVMYELIKRSRA